MKGNKHGGRKTRIKDYGRTKHARLSKANRKNRKKKAYGQ